MAIKTNDKTAKKFAMNSTRTCAVCGKKFKAKAANQAYCSAVCKVKAKLAARKSKKADAKTATDAQTKACGKRAKSANGAKACAEDGAFVIRKEDMVALCLRFCAFLMEFNRVLHIADIAKAPVASVVRKAAAKAAKKTTKA